MYFKGDFFCSIINEAHFSLHAFENVSNYVSIVYFSLFLNSYYECFDNFEIINLSNCVRQKYLKLEIKRDK